MRSGLLLMRKQSILRLSYRNDELKTVELDTIPIAKPETGITMCKIAQGFEMLL